MNFDSFSNFVTGLGAITSRAGQTSFLSQLTIPDHEITNLHKHNGLARRIVDIIVEDSLRGFIEADVNLIKKINSYSLKQLMMDAGCFGRLYGGALLVAFIDDGQEQDMPLSTSREGRLLSFKVFDRRQITWDFADLAKNLNSAYFGEPEIYTITPWSSVLLKDKSFSFRVHRSRCFLFGGAKVDNKSRVANNFWEDSVLQACYDTLRNYGLLQSASTDIVQDFIQTLVKMEGLGHKMSTEDGYKDVLRRMEMLERGRSTSRTFVLDAELEDYEKKASSVAGLADLWDRFSEAVSSSCGIPVTKLFGRSASGMNSTGEHDNKNWYDTVRSYRSDVLEPCINWFLEILKADKRNSGISKWEWEFPSLTAPNENEWADIKKKYAEIDCMYIDRGAIDPRETWQERYKDGIFNVNIKLSEPEVDVLAIEQANDDIVQQHTDDALNELIKNVRQKLK